MELDKTTWSCPWNSDKAVHKNLPGVADGGIGGLGVVVVVLSLGYVYLTIRITGAFGLPKLSLFCIVQRDVASLPSYSKLN